MRKLDVLFWLYESNGDYVTRTIAEFKIRTVLDWENPGYGDVAVALVHTHTSSREKA